MQIDCDETLELRFYSLNDLPNAIAKVNEPFIEALQERIHDLV
jgi:hypothetical protein